MPGGAETGCPCAQIAALGAVRLLLFWVSTCWGGVSCSEGPWSTGSKCCLAQGWCRESKEVPHVGLSVLPTHRGPSVKPSSCRLLTASARSTQHWAFSPWTSLTTPGAGAGHPLLSGWIRPHFAPCVWLRHVSVTAIMKHVCWWVKLTISPFALLSTRERFLGFKADDFLRSPKTVNKTTRRRLRLLSVLLLASAWCPDHGQPGTGLPVVQRLPRRPCRDHEPRGRVLNRQHP